MRSICARESHAYQIRRTLIRIGDIFNPLLTINEHTQIFVHSFSTTWTTIGMHLNKDYCLVHNRKSDVILIFFNELRLINMMSVKWHVVQAYSSYHLLSVERNANPNRWAWIVICKSRHRITAFECLRGIFPVLVEPSMTISVARSTSRNECRSMEWIVLLGRWQFFLSKTMFVTTSNI